MSKRSMNFSLLARGFARYEQQRLGFGALAASLLLAFFFFCTVSKPYFGSQQVVNMQLSMDVGLRLLKLREPIVSHQPFSDNKEMKTVCSIEPRTDFCDLTGDVRINRRSSTVFMATEDDSSVALSENSSWIIRPYPRKRDAPAMNSVREWTVKLVNTPAFPVCTRIHRVPAVLFSLAGYSGNIFHAFSDILIPLYQTSRSFNGEVQFVVPEKSSWWVRKYQEAIKNLSNYDVIYLDDEEDGEEKEEETHCFRNAIIGLKRNPEFNKELAFDSSGSSYSMSDFREFLRDAYSLPKLAAVKLGEAETRPPRLLILARTKTRAFENTDEVAETARKVGFEVVVAEANASVSSFASVVNSCDAMMGVHGAGLTNMVFLPENAVLIQILPIGGFEWMGKTYYAEPPKRMNLRYLEYKIGLEESSLMQRYPVDHEVLQNQSAVAKRGWRTWKSVYLDQQNVNLDVNRFKSVLLEALDLLHQ